MKGLGHSVPSTGVLDKISLLSGSASLPGSNHRKPGQGRRTAVLLPSSFSFSPEIQNTYEECLETKVQRIHNVDGWAWGTLEGIRVSPEIHKWHKCWAWQSKLAWHSPFPCALLVPPSGTDHYQQQPKESPSPKDSGPQREETYLTIPGWKELVNRKGAEDAGRGKSTLYEIRVPALQSRTHGQT